MTESTPTPAPHARPGIVQGASVDGSDRGALGHALIAACDYRGDVTLALQNGRHIEGFLFDCKFEPPTARSGVPVAIRMLPRDGSERITIHFTEIVSLDVTGKDTAEGKTFENWVRRYAERKLRGEAASIESDSLEA